MADPFTCQFQLILLLVSFATSILNRKVTKVTGPSNSLFKSVELNALGKDFKILNRKGYVSWGKRMEIGRNQVICF